MKNSNAGFMWLQNWFNKYCDGDWEHNEIIKIRNVDNPGWRVTIKLEGTKCENQEFLGIEKEVDNLNWYQCFLREGKFEGAGGPLNLSDILDVFQKWSEIWEIKD